MLRAICSVPTAKKVLNKHLNRKSRNQGKVSFIGASKSFSLGGMTAIMCACLGQVDRGEFEGEEYYQEKLAHRSTKN